MLGPSGGTHRYGKVLKSSGRRGLKVRILTFKGQQSFELLPFGSGRRMCPGINMGLTNVMFVCANLLHCFEWKVANNGMKGEEVNMEEEFGLTIRKKVPLYLVPIKYNWEDYKP